MSRWVLRRGDCLDPVSGLASLADRSVDVVISDPPYEAEAHTEQRRQKGTCTTVSGNSEFREVNETPLDFGEITADQRTAAHHQRRTHSHDRIMGSGNISISASRVAEGFPRRIHSSSSNHIRMSLSRYSTDASSGAKLGAGSALVTIVDF